MPKRPLDRQKTLTELLKLIKNAGPLSRRDLQEKLAISQPTISRFLTGLKDQIVPIGKGKELKYAYLNRSYWEIFEVSPQGTISSLGKLQGVEPRGFIFQKNYFRDLPYFLNDMRPAGFLGRFVPTLHPELNLPHDILTWDAETTLHYLSHAGSRAPGNLLIGERMGQHFLFAKAPQEFALRERYETLAKETLSHGVPGSSAAGEQPKFLVQRKDETQLIVKFSPPINETIGRRIADILICEHIALSLVDKNLLKSAQSEIVIDQSRVFLEVERFDRKPAGGRQGVISLGSLVAEFIGLEKSWTTATKSLAKLKIIPTEWISEVCTIELFGHLIANSDMHLFNLSFLSEQSGTLISLAPIYDMCPMLFAPRGMQLIPVDFTPPIPNLENKEAWSIALPLALLFWEQVANDARISDDFHKIAIECSRSLAVIAKQIV